MPLEEYNPLSYDNEHCVGTHCEKASQCLHHTTYTLLKMNKPIIKCFDEESITCYHIFTQHQII